MKPSTSVNLEARDDSLPAFAGGQIAAAPPVFVSPVRTGALPRGLITRLYPVLAELWQMLDACVVLGALYGLALYHGAQSDQELLILSGLTVGLMLLVYSWSDLFYRLRTRTFMEEGWRLLQAWGAVLMSLLVVGFLADQTHLLSKDLLLAWALLAFAGQLAVHVAIRKMLHSVRERGYNIRHAIIVGCGAPLETYARFIAQNPWLGIRVAGYVAETGWLSQTAEDNARPGSMATVTDIGVRSGQPAIQKDSGITLPHLGRLSDVGRLVESLSISEIYVTLPLERSRDAETAMRALVNVPVNVNWVPDFSLAQMLSTRVDSINGRPLVLLSDSRIDRHGQLVKRIEDVVLTSLLLVLLAPLMIAIACAIKYSSPGPVLFKQERHGMGGRRIVVWKFRTMRMAMSGEVRRQATAEDDRVTAIGRLLRRSSLDELPQLFNVLRSDMSLVGPRPHPIWLNDQFSRILDAYMQRHRVKPGLTGWAQVHGLRGETDTTGKMEQRVKFDLYYITHWSPLLDLEILARTLPAVILGKNAH